MALLDLFARAVLLVEYVLLNQEYMGMCSSYCEKPCHLCNITQFYVRFLYS